MKVEAVFIYLGLARDNHFVLSVLFSRIFFENHLLISGNGVI